MIEGIIFIGIVIAAIVGLYQLDKWHMRYAARSAFYRAMEHVYGRDRTKWPSQ